LLEPRDIGISLHICSNIALTKWLYIPKQDIHTANKNEYGCTYGEERKLCGLKRVEKSISPEELAIRKLVQFHHDH
jgi:hypothetical protein